MPDDPNDVPPPIDSAAGAPGYDRTQKGIIHHFLWILGVSIIIAALFTPLAPAALYAMTGGGVLSLLATFLFCRLSVRDEGNYLEARFGPVGLFGTRVRYDEIAGVEIRRLTLIDGIGVHYSLSGGWIYNIRGGDCVTVSLAGGGKVSIGTDDPEGLAAFLRDRMPGGGA